MDRQGEEAALVDNETKGLLNDLNFAFRTNDQKLATPICRELNDQLRPLSERMAEFQTVGKTQSATFKCWDNFLKGGHLICVCFVLKEMQTFCYTWMLFP
jgi:hypothetical protein